MFLTVVSCSRKMMTMMTYTSIVSASAITLLVIYMLYITLGKGSSRQGIWLFPAGISFLFLLYSLQTIMAEGPLGFWAEHIATLWGTQIWVDLLIAIGIGWFFVAPRAKALGMRTLPWVIVILLTGCIGFLVMVARVFYLEEKHALQQASV